MDIVTGVGVLDKAMALLRSVAVAPRGLGELQAETEIPRATAHRLAVALEAHGLLRRTADGRFDLGSELVMLGGVARDRAPIATLARPLLESLRHQTGESVQLFQRDGDRRRCLVSLESPHALRWIVPEGARLPLEVGSAGRILHGERGPQGWVESVEEREPGVASMSAPVNDRAGLILAAVCVSGPVERLSRSPGQRFGTTVLGVARELSALLG